MKQLISFFTLHLFVHNFFRLILSFFGFFVFSLNSWNIFVSQCQESSTQNHYYQQNQTN